jgi:hypothetical protein
MRRGRIPLPVLRRVGGEVKAPGATIPLVPLVHGSIVAGDAIHALHVRRGWGGHQRLRGRRRPQFELLDDHVHGNDVFDRLGDWRPPGESEDVGKNRVIAQHLACIHQGDQLCTRAIRILLLYSCLQVAHRIGLIHPNLHDRFPLGILQRDAEGVA